MDDGFWLTIVHTKLFKMLSKLWDAIINTIKCTLTLCGCTVIHQMKIISGGFSQCDTVDVQRSSRYCSPRNVYRIFCYHIHVVSISREDIHMPG